MRHLIQELVRQMDSKRNFSVDDLYKVGMDNVRQNIEFYCDKTYTCESVIKELFIRGVMNYINTSFPYLEK